MQLKVERRKLEYECDRCRKTRILYIATSLHKNVDSQGYQEYVDVHQCLEDKMTAIILFVDKFFTVRSQEKVKVGDDLSSNQIMALNIPMPTKVDFCVKEVKSLPKFKHKNIYEVKIIDKLRQTTFYLECKKTGGAIEVNSELDFVNLKIKFNKKVDPIIIEEWFKQVGSIMEAKALLDEEMLSYLFYYMDPLLEDIPTTDNLIHMDFILSAKTVFPTTNLKNYAIFKKQWLMMKDLLTGEFPEYDRILTRAINNTRNKNLLDVYEKLAEKIEFSTYMIYIYELSTIGIMIIDRVEFITSRD